MLYHLLVSLPKTMIVIYRLCIGFINSKESIQTTIHSWICNMNQTSFKNFNIYTDSCQKSLQSYHHTFYSGSGINSRWIVKNSKGLLEPAIQNWDKPDVERMIKIKEQQEHGMTGSSRARNAETCEMFSQLR